VISEAKLPASWIALRPQPRAQCVAFAKPRVVDYVTSEPPGVRVEMDKIKPAFAPRWAFFDGVERALMLAGYSR